MKYFTRILFIIFILSFLSGCYTTFETSNPNESFRYHKIYYKHSTHFVLNGRTFHSHYYLAGYKVYRYPNRYFHNWDGGVFERRRFERRDHRRRPQRYGDGVRGGHDERNVPYRRADRDSNQQRGLDRSPDGNSQNAERARRNGKN